MCSLVKVWRLYICNFLYSRSGFPALLLLSDFKVFPVFNLSVVNSVVHLPSLNPQAIDKVVCLSDCSWCVWAMFIRCSISQESFMLEHWPGLYDSIGSIYNGRNRNDKYGKGSCFIVTHCISAAHDFTTCPGCCLLHAW